MNKVFQTGDELNIYLVSKGLKPTTLVGLNSPFRGCNKIEIKAEDIPSEEKHIINDFKEYLSDLGLSYKQKDEENLLKVKGDNVTDLDMAVFLIGKDKESLEKLVKARNDEEIGAALGFPEKAVKAFDKIISGERKDGTYFMVSLSKAKKAGMELPRWLAYISFIPEELDIVNGNISETSKVIGERYQSFVRNNNPGLAERVEQDFLDMRLPDEWENIKNQGYVLKFEYPYNNK